MKILKKNQVIIYVIAIMIMTAGYLNYTTKTNEQALETSMHIEAKDDMLLADIGDATLVNSNDVITENEESSSFAGENDKTEENYFVQSKLERNTMYSQMIETYEKILNSSNSLETQKQTATQELTRINELKNSIMICENLLTTKGFDKNVIFVNDNSINIVIGSEELLQEQVAQIQNIVTRELKADIEDIHISIK